jgi:hypothetical protein
MLQEVCHESGKVLRYRQTPFGQGRKIPNSTYNATAGSPKRRVQQERPDPGLESGRLSLRKTAKTIPLTHLSPHPEGTRGED